MQKKDREMSKKNSKEVLSSVDDKDMRWCKCNSDKEEFDEEELKQAASGYRFINHLKVLVMNKNAAKEQAEAKCTKKACEKKETKKSVSESKSKK